MRRSLFHLALLIATLTPALADAPYVAPTVGYSLVVSTADSAPRVAPVPAGAGWKPALPAQLAAVNTDLDGTGFGNSNPGGSPGNACQVFGFPAPAEFVSVHFGHLGSAGLGTRTLSVWDGAKWVVVKSERDVKVANPTTWPRPGMVTVWSARDSWLSPSQPAAGYGELPAVVDGLVWIAITADGGYDLSRNSRVGPPYSSTLGTDCVSAEFVIGDDSGE